MTHNTYVDFIFPKGRIGINYDDEKKCFFLAGRASACCKIHLKNVCCTNTTINQAVGRTNKGGMFLKINKKKCALDQKKVMMRFEKSGCFLYANYVVKKL